MKCPCCGTGEVFNESVAAKRLFGSLRETDYSKEDFAKIKAAYLVLARARKPAQVDADVRDKIRAEVARTAARRQRTEEREETLAGARE